MVGAVVGIKCVTHTGVVVPPGGGVTFSSGVVEDMVVGSVEITPPSPVVMPVVAVVLTVGVVGLVVRTSSEDSSEDWLSEDSLDSHDSSD